MIRDIIPLQDVVIRNAQEENKNPEPKVIETVVEETKLSPYAKMVIEKKFIKCGHSTVEVIDIPTELINMTEKEIQEKYKNWEIRLFNSNEVSLFREIVANCDDHFVLKEKDGYLAIYKDVTDGTMNLKEVVGVTEIKTTDGQDYPSRTNVFSISGNTVILNVADGGAEGINTTFSVTACGYK